MALDVAERFADGKASLNELDTVEWHAELPTFGFEFDPLTAIDSPESRRWIDRLVQNGFEGELIEHRGGRIPNARLRYQLRAAACLVYYCTYGPPLDTAWGWEFRVLTAHPIRDSSALCPEPERG
jgi:hypothetical protein